MKTRLAPVGEVLREALSPQKQHHVKLQRMYAVVGNTDNIEGRGAPVTLGYRSTAMEARFLAKGKGPMGSDADVEEVLCLCVCTPDMGSRLGEEMRPRFVVEVAHVFDLKPEPTVRERALAKLTREEREALGL